MNANSSVVIALRMEEVRALVPRATGLDTLRALAGEGIRPLGHDQTPDYSFLAAGGARGALRELVRSFVWLPAVQALVDFDIAETGDSPAAVSWKLEGAGNVTTVFSRPGEQQPKAESSFLHVVWRGQPHPFAPIDSTDLAGLRIEDHVLAFHNETRMARSAVSFDVAGPAALKFLVTGLAPGEWEIWSGGMLEIPEADVRPEAGALAFAGAPGSYFLRRLGG